MLFPIANTPETASDIANTTTIIPNSPPLLRLNQSTNTNTNTIETTSDIANTNTNANANIFSININEFNQSVIETENQEDQIQKDINKLIDMGFTESIARTAVNNTNSLEEAINLLIGSM